MALLTGTGGDQRDRQTGFEIDDALDTSLPSFFEPDAINPGETIYCDRWPTKSIKRARLDEIFRLQSSRRGLESGPCLPERACVLRIAADQQVEILRHPRLRVIPDSIVIRLLEHDQQD